MVKIIKGDKFYYNNSKYKIHKRIATNGEYIIAIPEKYQPSMSLIRKENSIPFYEPLKVSRSLNNTVFFSHLRDGLLHEEYYVVTPIVKHKIKTGEVVKKILGLPVWKTTYYEFIEN